MTTMLQSAQCTGTAQSFYLSCISSNLAFQSWFLDKPKAEVEWEQGIDAATYKCVHNEDSLVKLIRFHLMTEENDLV